MLSTAKKKRGAKQRPPKGGRSSRGDVLVTGVCSDALAYAMAFFECCDTPRSLALYLMCKHNELETLVSMKISPGKLS